MTNQLLVVTACGAVVGFGLFLVLATMRTAPVRLADAISVLDGPEETQLDSRSGTAVEDQTALDRIGVWLYRSARLPLPESTRRSLALQARPIGDFFAEKLVWMVIGLVLPVMIWVLMVAMGQRPGAWPAGVILIGVAIGYFIPDLRLRGTARQTREGASEALFMFFDLVTLDRLANRSVTQALHTAAGVSDVAIFQRIRHGLDRARLEQIAPWQELKRLSTELNLPVIADMADVLRLDEQGASLAEPLRARVRELRDAQVSEARRVAQEQTERMTLWMTLPVLVLGITLIAPALLRLLIG